jgi:tetratricopeptide (TPR) repeat protein
MMEVMRRALASGWAPRKHYCFCWALVRAGRAEEALLELRSIDHAAFEGDPSAWANCQVLAGRALLQLQRYGQALLSFQEAVVRIEVSPIPLIDVNVLANAKIGLGATYTKLAKYKKAERAFAEAIKLSTLGSHATLMKAYHSAAILASAQGLYTEAWSFLLGRHNIAMEISRDVVLRAETLAEANVARARCPGKKVSPEAMCRLLRILRRTGKAQVVSEAARCLAPHVRPKRRLRVKCHPERVARRGRCSKNAVGVHA